MALAGVLALHLLNAPAALADDFKWVGREKEVALFERWIPSRNGTQVRELKAVFVVHAEMQVVVRGLKEESRGTRWNVSAADFRILQTARANQWISYIRYDIPWPLDDQDCCLKYQLAGNDNRKVIQFASILNQRFPVTAGIDRITGVRGKWILQNQGDHTTKVVYLITTDQSKKVPRWLSDRIIHHNIYETMAAFKAMAEHAV